jgi:hypothetical protein
VLVGDWGYAAIIQRSHDNIHEASEVIDIWCFKAGAICLERNMPFAVSTVFGVLSFVAILEVRDLDQASLVANFRLEAAGLIYPGKTQREFVCLAFLAFDHKASF